MGASLGQGRAPRACWPRPGRSLRPCTRIRRWLLGGCCGRSPRLGCGHTARSGASPPTPSTPGNVEVWATTVNRDRPRGWRNASRSVLRQVGRAVNPLGWPEQPDEVGRPPACPPYDAIDEALYREAAGLPGVDDLATTLWVAAASCGAGMRGPEISAAQLDDLSPVGADRLAVQVRGRDARLTPIRSDWTDTARQALALARQRPERCARFIIPQDRNAAARAANRIRIGDTALSLRRARATWLTAHLEAGTPLPVLREIAGPLATATLDDLLVATSAITAKRAVTEALRA